MNADSNAVTGVNQRNANAAVSSIVPMAESMLTKRPPRSANPRSRRNPAIQNTSGGLCA